MDTFGARQAHGLLCQKPGSRADVLDTAEHKGDQAVVFHSCRQETAKTNSERMRSSVANTRSKCLRA